MASSTQPLRVLPPDVYDALELSALAYGGIGGGAYVDRENDSAFSPAIAPRCIIGHARWLAGTGGPVEDAIESIGIDPHVNDEVILSGNHERISWAEYCRRANIVRGEG
jgi:hypothetical protein